MQRPPGPNQRIGPNCAFNYPTELFATPADYDTAAKILAKVNDPPLTSAVTGISVLIDKILGGITRDATTDAVTGAEAGGALRTSTRPTFNRESPLPLRAPV